LDVDPTFGVFSTMKKQGMKILLAAVALTALTSVQAAPLSPEEQRKKLEEIQASTQAVIEQANAAIAQYNFKVCEAELIAAGRIMGDRQNGKLITTLLAEVKKEQETVEVPPWAPARVNALITEAYKVPRYRSPKVKEDAITDFQNDAFVKCQDWWAKRTASPSK